MRITALSSTLVLGTLVLFVAPAHAEHKAAHAANQVASLTSPARNARPAPSLTTGDLALTGPTRSACEDRPAPFLAAGEITALVTPHAPEIERCYLDELSAIRRPGRLDLTFVIARDGSVLSLAAKAPGVPARTTHKIEACIHAALDGVEFPARRNDTTAVVPYFFQRTDAPNAGPQLSCWNPKGC